MNKIDRYLELVPLPVLVGLPLLLMAAAMLMPRQYRMQASLIVMVLWLAIGRLPELVAIQAPVKATQSVPLLMVMWGALTAPGPRRSLPWVVWLFPILGLCSFVYVLGVNDLPITLVLRFNWVLMAVAALLVARTIVDRDSFHRVIVALTIGLIASLMVPLGSFVINPRSGFESGLGRFQPEGSNANQIGTLFMLTAPFCLYLLMNSPGIVRKVVYGTAGAAAMGLAVMTGSRSTVFTMMMPILAMLLPAMRRPGVALLAGVIGVAVVTFVTGLGSQDVRYDRLSSLQSERTIIWREYADVISTRPIAGLLGTDDQSYFYSKEVGVHPHNTYLEVLYVGGLSYAVPLFFLMGYAIFSAVVIWLSRRRFTMDPLTTSFFTVMVPAMHFHGLFLGAILYPTYELAFIYVLFCVLAIAWAQDIRRLRESLG